jgi:hypothetical protein
MLNYLYCYYCYYRLYCIQRTIVYSLHLRSVYLMLDNMTDRSRLVFYNDVFGHPEVCRCVVAFMLSYKHLLESGTVYINVKVDGALYPRRTTNRLIASLSSLLSVMGLNEYTLLCTYIYTCMCVLCCAVGDCNAFASALQQKANAWATPQVESVICLSFCWACSSTRSMIACMQSIQSSCTWHWAVATLNVRHGFCILTALYAWLSQVLAVQCIQEIHQQWTDGMHDLINS